MAKHVQAVRRWGNSRAVVISQRVQDLVTWPLRELVHVSVEHDRIVLGPVNFPKGAARDAAAKPEAGAA